MDIKFLLNIISTLHLFRIVMTLHFSSITNEVFQFGENSGIIAAFGNINLDELTDVFFIQGWNKLKLSIGTKNETYFELLQINCSTFGDIITSVVPSDFNGDSFPDVLVTLQKGEIHKIKILWGKKNFIDCDSELTNEIKLTSQPLIVDFNGDMIPDIMGETEFGRYVWISNLNRTFHKIDISHLVNQKFKKPHSSGLIDLNNDMASDILITGENNIEKWYNTGKNFTFNGTYDYPEKCKVLGQSSFVDINQNGILTHILPICYDDYCKDSAILAWNSKMLKWMTLLDKFTLNNIKWGFKLPSDLLFEREAFPITLRAGDINMDGYPDFITILQSKTKPYNAKGVIILNVPCNDDCNSLGRSLEIIWNVPGLEDLENIQIAAFFDIFEDGILDILASTKTKEGWKIHALKNVETDSCFMKVLVLSGLSYKNVSEEIPYGNQPGPMVRYNTTTQDGQPIVSVALQLSQSAHFPLQLPYTYFGLGQTPNFIDSLTVSIPAKYDEYVHKRIWAQIIPNSQIVVIPLPPNEETRWIRKLFVTPSHLVHLTCIALIGTCLFITLLVGLLYWKEKKEDKKEKMQDAYRFHFDAM